MSHSDQIPQSEAPRETTPNPEVGPGLDRRRFLLAGTAAGAAALAGRVFAQDDLDGAPGIGIDVPGERTAAVGADGPIGWRMPQGWRGLNMNFYEMSGNDPAFLEVYGYCDQHSYGTGETVKLHMTTTAPVFAIEVYRDGPARQVVYAQTGVPGRFTVTPLDAYTSGCGWPVLHEIPIDPAWRSGFYVILLKVEQNGMTKQAEAGFVLRGAGQVKIACMLTTCTWQAYNAWGGANNYGGIHGPAGDAYSPILSFQRPWERGFILAPGNYPYQSTVSDRFRLEREAGFTRAPGAGYPFMMGYGWGANSAGWALDNRPFAIWAEEQGYAMDYLAQTDLDRGPAALAGYDLLVITGHDEYHTWAQRDTIDAFVEGGGRLVRFGANAFWQARLEDGGSRQVCYKLLGEGQDPVEQDPARRHLLTACWEHRFIQRPTAQTFGVTGVKGVYAAYEGGTPRAGGGFTVYRPEHWAFAGTQLLYGDSFGTEEGILGYEIDGLDYGFRYGLPYPTEMLNPLPGTEILALSPGMIDQFASGDPGDAVRAMGQGDFLSRYLARAIDGNEDPETLEKYRRGSGMIVVAPKGRGEIFTAATVYWFLGLKWRNRTVEQITHNVLRRYMGEGV